MHYVLFRFTTSFWPYMTFYDHSCDRLWRRNGCRVGVTDGHLESLQEWHLRSLQPDSQGESVCSLAWIVMGPTRGQINLANWLTKYLIRQLDQTAAACGCKVRSHFNGKSNSTVIWHVRRTIRSDQDSLTVCGHKLDFCPAVCNQSRCEPHRLCVGLCMRLHRFDGDSYIQDDIFRRLISAYFDIITVHSNESNLLIRLSWVTLYGAH